MPDRTTKLALDKIRRDGGTQPRAQIDSETVDTYAERMREGDKFPAVVVFYDGSSYWLGDGFHRVEAAEREDWKTIEADVRQGTQRDAILHSVSANSEHGKPRSNADKRRAVMTVLTNELVCKNEAGSPWSDRAIARLCSVGAPFVATVRSELSVTGLQMDRKAVTRNGKTFEMNTANIGRKPSDKLFTCPDCGDTFDAAVWHCKHCDHHWQDAETECRNCHTERGAKTCRNAVIAAEKAYLDATDPLLAAYRENGGSKPKALNIKRSGIDEDDDVPATVTLERPVEHVVTRKPKEVTALDVIDMVRKAIWNVYQAAPEELKSIVAPKFRDFAGELERTGDLAW